MLENPHASWWYSSTVGTLKTVGSDNPQVSLTISREVLSDPVSQPDSMTPQRLHADSSITRGVIQAYLQGALHDGTPSVMHHTHRIVQKGLDWLDRLQYLFTLIGHRSWKYQEGKKRVVWALETSAKFLDVKFDPFALVDPGERLAYVRGYFDAEGSAERSEKYNYVHLYQKDRIELSKVHQILTRLGITCGRLHNPSSRVDPDYWRFAILAKGRSLFARIVGSWHPRKEEILRKMI